MSIVELDGDVTALRGDIRLDGREIDAILGAGLVSFEEELTIDGVPVMRLGVLDPDGELMQSEMFDHDGNGRLDRPVTLVVDRVAYRLAGIQKGGDTYTLTFEDRTVALLRNQRGQTSAPAGSTDHVGFARRLVENPREVGARLVTGVPGPEELRKLRKTGLRIREQRAKADDDRQPGFADGARLRVKTAWATRSQLEIASRLLTVAYRLRAGPRATVALIAVAIQESFLTNDPTADENGSVGVLQARVDYSTSHLNRRVTREQAMDVEFNAESFLRDPGWADKGGAMRHERENPDWSPGQIGWMVEKGPPPSAYDQWRDQAEAIVDAFTGGSWPLASGGRRTRIQQLSRGTKENRNEDSWSALKRIAEAWGYRCFVVGNVVYYISEESLMRSRPRMTLSEAAPGVEWIDWEWMPRKRVNLAEVTCRAEAWQAPPGTVVLLDEDCTPADGRWLVREYRRSRFSPTAQIQLARGAELLKPDVPTEEVQADPRRISGPAAGRLDGVDAGGVPASVMRAYAKAVEISDKDYPYVYGGGHGRVGVPSTGEQPGIGYDCSSYTVAQLGAGGMGFELNAPGVPASGWLATSWGEYGEGRWMTVWAHGTHVFVQYKVPGAAWRADTVGPGESGPHIRTTDVSTAGFTPRHWPGT